MDAIIKRMGRMGIEADIALAVVAGFFVSWLTGFSRIAVILIYVITLVLADGITNYARGKRPSPMFR